jgi:hypothetical protein
MGTGKESVWVWECGGKRGFKGSNAPDGAGSKKVQIRFKGSKRFKRA